MPVQPPTATPLVLDVERPAATELDTAGLRKARGAFFTPEPLARYVTDWAVRSAGDAVLEPSCGEAAFLLAAVERFRSLAARPLHPGETPAGTLDGVEMHEASAAEAERLLRLGGVPARVRAADFFTVTPTGSYDVVIGNPPYIRFQDFGGEARLRSRSAALRGGVALSAMASSWAAFTVHSALFLKQGGRLGLVLPAELLSVNYAAEVRRFLLQQFASVELILFTERVFPGVLEDVVVLLADGYRQGPTDKASLREVRNVADLAAMPDARTWRPARPEDKWTPGLLAADAVEPYSSLLSGAGFSELERWGDVTLGAVTGANKYFALPPARVVELGLGPEDVVPLSPPGSRHLRGLSLTSEQLSTLGAGGAATWLFRPAGPPSEAADQYIEAGHTVGVDAAYKCRVRKPWWRVPLSPPADLLLTYMNADTPRLCANLAGAHNLNSVHGVYLRPSLRSLGRRLLSLASLNAVTLLGAETVGRAYGGGMLKLEPGEADRLPVPSPELVEAAASALATAAPRVGQLLAEGRLLDAVAVVDAVLLTGQLGIETAELKALRAARATLADRRAARGAAKGRHR